jgi:SulP family sulfate permease
VVFNAVETGTGMSDTAIQVGGIFRFIGTVFRAPLARSLVSSAVVGVLSILFYLSYATLIFSGPLTPWLSYGIAASFITGAIAGAGVAMCSSLRFQIAGPDGATCAVIAALVAAVTAHLADKGADAGLLTATMVTLALSSAATGIFLCSLGVARAGRIIRFVPFPVIGGFLGASGLLMLIGAIKVVTGNNLGLGNIGQLLGLDSMAKLLAGLAVFGFLVIGRRYWPSTLAMPVQLLLAILIFYTILRLLRISPADAQAHGWT